jgi:hypothetical protein
MSIASPRGRRPENRACLARQELGKKCLLKSVTEL